MWIPFYVVCECGKRNKADYVVAESFRLVLRGEFKTCRQCKREFTRIDVPGRKGIRDELKVMETEGVQLPAHIAVYEVSGRPSEPRNACAWGRTTALDTDG